MPLAEDWKFSFSPLSKREGELLELTDCVRLSRVDQQELVAQVRDETVVHLVEIDSPWRSNKQFRWTCTCYDSRPCRHAWAAMMAADRKQAQEAGKSSAGAMTTSSSRPRSASSWKAQLERIRRNDAGQALQHVDRSSRQQRQRQVWYVLDISHCFERGALVVRFFQRELRRDGSWGRYKALNLTREMQPQLEPADREIAMLIQGFDPPATNYYYGYSYGQPRCNSVTLNSSAYDTLLPRLCATGRLVWLLEAELGLDEARPLTYDDGPPYRFRMRTEWRDGQLAVRGEFARGDERIGVERPIIVMGNGVLVMPDYVARVEARDAFPWIVELRRAQEIVIPRREHKAFLRDLLSIRQLPEIELPPELAVEQAAAPPQPYLCFHEPDSHPSAQSVVRGEVQFDYAGQRFACGDAASGFLGEAGKQICLRQPTLERQFTDQLYDVPDLITEENGRVFVPIDRFTNVIDALIARGWVVEASGGQIRRPGSMSLQVRTQIDWFSLEGGLQFDDQVVAMPELLAAIRQRRKLVRLGDGSQGLLPEEWLERFGVLADLSAAKSSAEEGSDGLRFARCQALLLDALLAETQFEADTEFAELKTRLTQVVQATPAAAPATFQGTLRDYQCEGVGWLEMLSQLRLGGCLADDMGLGKTIQVLALLERRRTEGQTDASATDQPRPSIVVVPKSLVFNWVDEAGRFTPDLRVLNYTGLGRAAVQPALPEYDLIVTTYGTLRRDILKLKDVPFDYAILDEAQAIKNPQSQAAKAARLLKARHRLALTGTPVENHLGELWSLFEFINPGMLGRASAFQQLTRNGTDDTSDLKRLARGLRPFLLRRTKQQVLAELPQKTEQTLYCELSKRERRQYDELRDFFRGKLLGKVKQDGLAKAKMHVLEALLRLRQAACHMGLLDALQIQQSSAKLEALFEQLEEVLDGGHKALVFSQFTSLLSIVRHHFDARKIPYEYLDGRTRQRKACVERFQNDPNCPLFLISLKAGGHGLNLTAADYVFILDPWWNPAVEAQAIDRAHRLGQERHVFAYRLISRDTVEEKILELQREKRELAEAIISEDNSVLRNLTQEDLELLFS